MQEIVAGRQEEDEEMQETVSEEKAAPLTSGSRSRYLAINCYASYRVKVIYGIHVTIDLSCITERSLCIKVYILHCALPENLPVCFHSSTSTL